MSQTARQPVLLTLAAEAIIPALGGCAEVLRGGATTSGLVERGLLRLVLERCRGHRGQAADKLGMHRNTLRQKIAALGLEAAGFAGATARPPADRSRSRR